MDMVSAIETETKNSLYKVDNTLSVSALHSYLSPRGV